jgi:uncharacterized CHY-type Zn-finger protein
MKICPKCGIKKPLSTYSKNKNAKDGHVSECKACAKIRAAEYYSKNAQEIIKKTRGWAIDNPERRKEIARNSHTKRKYGITLEQEIAIKMSQNNKCAICNDELKKHAHIDHDHKTGKVRAILCLECNTGLGKFKENPKIFKSALKYLQKYSNKLAKTSV